MFLNVNNFVIFIDRVRISESTKKKKKKKKKKKRNK